MSVLSRVNSVIDTTVGFFSPQAELNRIRSRMASSAIRGYDAAGSGWNNPFNVIRGSTAGSEASKNAGKLSAVGQELTRNNPLANRIKSQWASNVVGSGITLDLVEQAVSKALSKRQTKKSKADKMEFLTDWETWANSTVCDFDGHYNFYGLQWLWMSTIVESGGVIVRKHINASMAIPLQLQTIEQAHLSKEKDGEYDDGLVVDGIKFNKLGQRVGCYIKIIDINIKLSMKNEPTYHLFGQDVVYLYRKERSGQHIGISWLHNVATTLEKYQATQDAKITQLQIAACLALIVKDAEQSIGGVTKSVSTIGTEISAGGVEHVAAGTEIETITPPNPSESSAFMKELKDDIAAGVGLTYAQLTGDYSKFNFASGRMSKIDFFMILSFVQLNVIKPSLNTIYTWFGEARWLKSGKINNFLPKWEFPARAAVDPSQEFEVLFKKCRSGVISPKQFATQLGEKLEESIEGWNESKELWGDLVFDVDPSKFTSAGNQLNDDDAAASNNAVNAAAAAKKAQDKQKAIDNE